MEGESLYPTLILCGGVPVSATITSCKLKYPAYNFRFSNNLTFGQVFSDRKTKESAFGARSDAVDNSKEL